MDHLPLFITSAQVARVIGYDNAGGFLSNRKRLENDTLFPLPMPTHTRRSLRWRRDEVMAWVDRHGLPRPTHGQSNLHLLRMATTV
jgi:hypothetical protein